MQADTHVAKQIRIALVGERLAAFFQREASFELELKNFGAFRHDVLFIDVMPQLALLEMQARLSVYLRSEPKLVHSGPYHIGYKPHLTVANRDVDAHTHHKMWEEFNTRKFFARFLVDKATLLRHTGKVWQSVQNFTLHGVSDLTSSERAGS